MALSAAVEWDVRTTGNDGNGGGFKAGATGQDYSLQDAAQKSGADLTMHATTNTKCHPAAAGVAATDVGNIVNITAGTGWTPGRYEITSQDGTDWTLDRSPSGAGNANLGTYAMGGAIATPGVPIPLAVDQNTVHIKAGTYTLTATITPGTGRSIKIMGYGTSHGDNGTRPLITTSTDSTNLFTLGDVTTAWANLTFSNTAAIRAYAITHTAAAGGIVISNCLFDGFSVAIFGDNLWTRFIVHGVEIQNCTSYGIRNDDESHIVNCHIHDNGSYGVYLGTNYLNNHCSVVRSIISDNGDSGIYGLMGGLVVEESTIANNSGDGIESAVNRASSVLLVVNSIFYNNSGWGIGLLDGALPSNLFASLYSAFGANGSGNYGRTGTATVTSPTVEVGLVALSANPFNDDATGDYSLNDNAGGGAALKGYGFPGLFPGGLTTGILDIGAVQLGEAGADYPIESNVRDGVSYAFGSAEGNLVLPPEVNVQSGIQYGANGTEYEGTLSGGSGASYLPAA